ncbi:MAG: hypothetical protein HKN16_00930 [Saprospiraceae bacterium]|nr:hypothetical protein [Saprospiraceae bacterium]
MAKPTPSGILLRLVLILAAYFGLKYYGGEVGRIILFPITRLVTFLHELGHALGAVITGGDVLDVIINNDGSGKTVTAGGSRGVILAGGYIGSAILGNLLVFIGAKKAKLSGYTLKGLAIVMVFTSIVWFGSLYSTGLLILFAISLWLIAEKTFFDRELLMFLGLCALLYIIQDFRVGPSSDLAAYSETVGWLPPQGWMYVWLGIVIVLSLINLRWILSSNK